MGTVNINLRAPTTRPGDKDPFFLECGPEQAFENVQFGEWLVCDDVIVHKTDPANPIPGMGYMADFTTEEPEESAP